MAFTKKIRLGDLLVEKGLITEDQLKFALGEQKKLGRKLGGTLIELGMIDEESILTLLSSQLKIPLIDITITTTAMTSPRCCRNRSHDVIARWYSKIATRIFWWRWRIPPTSMRSMKSRAS